MIKLIIVASCMCMAYSAPVQDSEVQILRYENNNDGLGHYNFEFETSDGTIRKEHSEVVNAGDPDNEKLIVRGEFQYIGPDGITYAVTYVADENGFHPQGNHLTALPEVEVSTISPPVLGAAFPADIAASLLG